MSGINNVLVFVIAIVVLIIIITVIRFIVRKKRLNEVVSKNQEAQEKIKQINQLDEEIEDALKRMISICKTAEALDLLEIWKKEYYAHSDNIIDLKDLFEKMQTEMEAKEIKEFNKLDETFNEKYNNSIEGINDIHEKLLTYTNYEMKNTEIAIELKEKIKDFKREIEILFASHDNYNVVMSQLNLMNEKLSEFEVKQKNGKYKEARDILKELNEELADMIVIFDVVNKLLAGEKTLEKDISATLEAKAEIEKIGYKLQIDEELEGIDKIQNYKTELNQLINEITFDEVKDYSEKIEELEINQSDLESIKNILLLEYQKIKDLIDAKESVETVKSECEELFLAADQEFEEVKMLYEITDMSKIVDIQEEVEHFETFKEDYEKLLKLIQDSKDNYSVLVEKLEESEKYLYRIMDKVKKSLFQIKEIREDEIKVREMIEENKADITEICLYLKHYEHFYELSPNLSHSIDQCYAKMNDLEAELNKTPLNIEEVRKNNMTIEALKEDLITSTHEEIKRKEAINKLVQYANKYVVDDEVETLILHINYLYNSREYASALKELRRLISVYSSEEIYKKIVSKVEVKSYEEYKSEVF